MNWPGFAALNSAWLFALIIPLVLLFVWIDPITHPPLAIVRDVLVWATIVVTIISGVPYVTGAMRAVKRPTD